MKHYVLAVNGTIEIVEVSKEKWLCVMHEAEKYATIERMLPHEISNGGLCYSSNLSSLEFFMNGTKLVGAIIEERSEK